MKKKIYIYIYIYIYKLNSPARKKKFSQEKLISISLDKVVSRIPWTISNNVEKLKA